jgi:prepilin-type N-terminal cleavage/methylation domain-containing protein
MKTPEHDAGPRREACSSGRETAHYSTQRNQSRRPSAATAQGRETRASWLLNPFPRAFTLVEILVVIAIISTLAAMIFPVAGGMRRRAVKARAQVELVQVETAIERYKAKYGFYPPDNAGPLPDKRVNPVTNQLYFELLGTERLNNGNYQTLGGSAQITAGELNAVFGAQVSGFVNSSASGGGDDGPVAACFLTGLKPPQIAELSSGVRLLVCSVAWPEDQAYQPVPTQPGANPWRYVSSRPTNNPSSFDLWIDIMIGGKTNRISNWSKQPQIVSVP